MILVDAATIHMGGALVLLDTLVKYLEINKVLCCFIVSVQVDSTKVFKKNQNFIIYQAKPFFKRSSQYREILGAHKNIQSVLCFYSFPPPLKLSSIRVYTYFHNLNLLPSSDISQFDLLYKIQMFFKRLYLKKCLSNSNWFIFQTSFVEHSFLKSYNYDKKRCMVLPFFDEIKLLELKKEIELECLPKIYDYCYISMPYPHKNHLFLLKAWETLFNQGYNFSLILTVPEINNEQIRFEIRRLQNLGVKIINIGVVDYFSCLKNLAQSNYCIFPTTSETIGLGLVEAYYLNIPVIASDLPFIHQVIKPSLCFDPYSVSAIANSVIKSRNENNLSLTTLVMENKLENLIRFLS